MIYVNQILEDLLTRESDTTNELEVSRLIVEKSIAAKMKEEYCNIKAEMRFDKYDKVLFKEETKCMRRPVDIIRELRELPCLIIELKPPYNNSDYNHILVVTNKK